MYYSLYIFSSVWCIEPILQDEVEDDVKEDHEYSLESENLEEHKSLILHLLSKIKTWHGFN